MKALVKRQAEKGLWHEFVGHIVEVGSNVQDFKVSDRISAEGHVVCGHCRNYLASRRHL